MGEGGEWLHEVCGGGLVRYGKLGCAYGSSDLEQSLRLASCKFGVKSAALATGGPPPSDHSRAARTELGCPCFLFRAASIQVRRNSQTSFWMNESKPLNDWYPPSLANAKEGVVTVMSLMSRSLGGGRVGDNHPCNRVLKRANARRSRSSARSAGWQTENHF